MADTSTDPEFVVKIVNLADAYRRAVDKAEELTKEKIKELTEENNRLRMRNEWLESQLKRERSPSGERPRKSVRLNFENTEPLTPGEQETQSTQTQTESQIIEEFESQESQSLFTTDTKNRL